MTQTDCTSSYYASDSSFQFGCNAEWPESWEQPCCNGEWAQSWDPAYWQNSCLAVPVANQMPYPSIQDQQQQQQWANLIEDVLQEGVGGIGNQSKLGCSQPDEQMPVPHFSQMKLALVQDRSQSGVPITLSDTLFGFQLHHPPNRTRSDSPLRVTPCHCAVLDDDAADFDAQSGSISAPKKQHSHGVGIGKCGSGAQGAFNTTAVVRNIPTHLKQSALINELEMSGFAGLFDFCYAPSSFQTGKISGYAFVNFVTSNAFDAFLNAWHGNHFFNVGKEHPALNVTVAAVQGFEPNMKTWARLRRVRNPELRPFADPNRMQAAYATGDDNEIVSRIKVSGRGSSPEVVPVPDWVSQDGSSNGSPYSMPQTPSHSLQPQVMPPPGLSLPDDVSSFEFAETSVF